MFMKLYHWKLVKVINPKFLIWKRKRLKISQKVIAKKYRCSIPYICQVEKGYRNCPERLLKIYLEL